MPEEIVEFKCESPQDVNDLIADLRGALKKAKRTGGTYHVGRKSEGGEFLIEIQVPMYREDV